MRNKFYLPLAVFFVGTFLWTVYAHEQKTSDGKQHVWVDNILTAQATSQNWKYKVVVQRSGGLSPAWYEDDRKLSDEPASALAKISELGNLHWELVSTNVEVTETSGHTVWIYTYWFKQPRL